MLLSLLRCETIKFVFSFFFFFPLTNAEKLHWPKQELSKKSVLSPEEHKLNVSNEKGLQQPSPGVLKDIFTTGTSSYNVLLQSKEEKKHHAQKQSPAHHKKHRKATKCSSTSRSNEHRKIKVPLPLLSSGWYCSDQQPSVLVSSPVSNGVKLANSISAAGNGIGLPPRPRSRAKRHCNQTKPKQSQSSKSRGKEGDDSGRKLCLLTAIKPSNVEKEKMKFFKSDFTYNPQFEYANPALPNVLAKHSQASDRFLKQVQSHFFLLFSYFFLSFKVIKVGFAFVAGESCSSSPFSCVVCLRHAAVLST